jgi:hypothetical protein
VDKRLNRAAAQILSACLFVGGTSCWADSGSVAKTMTFTGSAGCAAGTKFSTTHLIADKSGTAAVAASDQARLALKELSDVCRHACWASAAVLLTQTMPFEREREISGTSGGAAPVIAAATTPPPAVSADDQFLSELKELSEICHHLKGAAKDLINESQQINFNSLGNPILDNYEYAAVVIARGDSPGSNYDPLRKKWVDYHMSKMSFLYSELMKKGNELKPITSVPATAEIYSDMQNEATNFNNAYEKLVQDTKGPQYDNLSVASDAQAIIVSIDRIEQDRKDLMRAVKRDEKH